MNFEVRMTTTLIAPQKEPFWFRPAGRVFLLILAILSLGYFSGPFMASARRSTKVGQYLFTLVFCGWVNYNITHMGVNFYVAVAIVIFIMATFTRKLAPSAVGTSIQFQLQQSGESMQNFKLPEADGSGNGLTYFFKAKDKVQQLVWAQGTRKDGLASFYSDSELFRSNFPQIEFGTDPDSEQNLLSVENCELFEPRKGPTITDRETVSGGRPFIGTKVGPIFVGGSGRSTSHSRSITTPAPDIIQTVDSGVLLVTTRGISFVGEKYTRHVDFKTLISAQGEDQHMSFADSKKTSIWGAVFPNRVEMWTVNAIIGAVDELSDRRLDTSGKATVEDILAALKKSFDDTVEMLAKFYKDAYAEYETVNDQLREYHRVYPNQVTLPDPDPRKTTSPDSAIWPEPKQLAE